MLHYAKTLLGRSGAGSALDVQQVTSGSAGSRESADRQRGFISGSIGSCSDGASDIYGGAAVLELYWNENDGTPLDFIAFAVTGAVANSGWTQMAIGAVVLSRASATFTTSGGVSRWTWPNRGYSAGTNPFGADLSSHSVTFT